MMIKCGSLWLGLACFSLNMLFAVEGDKVPAVEAKQTVALSVDPKAVGDLVSDDFPGLSFETNDLLSGTSGLRNFRPENQALVRLFQTLGIKSLRIGGNTGDRDAKSTPTTADIDSLFAFAKAANVKVIYCLRLFKGDPQEAAKTAKYIVDRYAAQLECFSIGQEPSAYPVEKVDSRPVSERMGAEVEKYSYAEFSANWARFSAEILKVVPDAKFSGPGVHRDPSWPVHFMSDFGGANHVELITAHLYPGGPGGKVPTPESGRDRMLSDEFYSVYKGLYDGMVPTVKSKSLRYRLEEVNNFYNGGAVDVSPSFASALWGLDFMWWWASHNAAGVNFHTGDRVAAGSALQQCKYSAYYSTPDGYRVQPLGYGIKTFELGGKGRIIPVTMVGGKSWGRLSAYATVAQDNYLCVTLINKSHGTDASAMDITLNVNQPCVKGEFISLAVPNGDVALQSGMTLGGGEIDKTGTWNGKWSPLKISGAGKFPVKLPPASAMVLKVKLQSR